MDAVVYTYTLQHCHVRGTCTPSMKPGSYHVYVLLCREGEVASINTATCECAAGYVCVIMAAIITVVFQDVC